MLNFFICYVIVFKTYWGDYIKQNINWKLYNNKKLVVNKENIPCIYKEKQYIKFREDKNIINSIDLENNIFKRETDEFIFKIEFDNKKFYYTLKEKKLDFSGNLIKCCIEKGKEYILEYSLEDEEKKLIIQIL